MLVGEKRAVVGFGSNLGDRHATLRDAFRRVAMIEGVRVVRQSALRETAPVGPAQPDFLNGAALLETAREPVSLLTDLLAIEREMGRTRETALRWGPRVIDLDLLWVEGEIIDAPELTLPHPRLHERRFALEPLVEVAPDARDPSSGATYADLLTRLCGGEKAE
jgi:2-amino-4-hydroxy-6-hydroxymethyldihydropteridine diphosphokinase